MGFVDFAIDLAAVLNASRSVAAKHVALRSRQLENLNRASILKTNLRTQPPATPGAPAAEPVVPTAPPTSEASGPAFTAQKTAAQPVHVPHSSTSHAAPSFKPAQALRPDSDSVLSQLRDSKPGSFPWSDASALENKPSQARAAPAFGSPDQPDELGDLPQGVNVNIFHTKKGSSLLGELGREKPKPTGLPEFVTHSHSAKPVSPTPPSPEVTATPKAVENEEARLEKVAAQPVETPLASPIPEPPSRAEPSVKPYVLKESKVPSSRFGRIWNYSGLAAGMMGGAITESLGRAFGGSGQGSVLLSPANMERLVSKLSQMRGAALKFGQMMSFQDSKMLPGPIQEVMQRVQDRADYMPSWQRDKVLVSNLGPNWRDLFEEFEEKPIAAASIGQVHRATLKEGNRKVAVKIQFPGVADSINSDLDNLAMLLTATKLLPKGLYLNKTIDNARLELGWECDYEREAQCATRYQELLVDEPETFIVPKVHLEASGKQVITMDFMDGVGVTRVKSFTQEQKDWIGTQILRLCLREITEFRFMQTDPNWTNFLYNAETNKLELLDFGASREFPDEFVTRYVQLLAAASRSDREAIVDLSQKLGYLTGHESKIMVDAHVKSILTLAEPFLESAPEVYDFQDQTITERVKALIPVMLSERLAPPPEETYSLHRKLSGAFLLCARLGSKVRCRDMFAESLKKGNYI